MSNIRLPLPSDAFNLVRSGQKRAFLSSELFVAFASPRGLEAITLFDQNRPHFGIEIEVCRITISQFGELTTEDARALGYRNLNHLQADVRFDNYPDLVGDNDLISINHFTRTDRAGG